jgi:hypothetical protein
VSAMADCTGNAKPSSPRASRWLIRIDVLPVMCMRHRMGESRRDGYGKSIQMGAGFIGALTTILTNVVKC